MKLPLQITIIFSFSFLVFGACMSKKYPREYEFTSLEIKNANAKGKYPASTSDSLIDAGIYCIRTQLNLVETTLQGVTTKNDKTLFNTTPIDSLYVTSDEDFNSNYLAGSNLASLFRIYNDNYFDLTPADNFNSSVFEDQTQTEKGPFKFYEYLILAEKPTVLGKRKIFVEMVSGQKHFKDTLEVTLF